MASWKGGFVSPGLPLMGSGWWRCAWKDWSALLARWIGVGVVRNFKQASGHDTVNSIQRY